MQDILPVPVHVLEYAPSRHERAAVRPAAMVQRILLETSQQILSIKPELQRNLAVHAIQESLQVYSLAATEEAGHCQSGVF